MPGPSDQQISTLLVVEPDVLVRMVIAAYLRECGFTVIEGVTAEDAMAVLEAGHRVDIVFADVKPAGRLDGFGLAQWLRAHHPRIDVLLTSSVAKTAEKAADLCEECPLEKPYHPQEVVRRIKALLERRRADQ